MSRETFLARVRAAAQAGCAYRVGVDDVPSPMVGYVGGGDDLCQRLADEVQAVGGKPWLAADGDAARTIVVQLLDFHAVSSTAPGNTTPCTALCWQHPLLDRLQIAALLESRQVRKIDFATLSQLPPADQRHQMLAANVGITSCTWAIAETGSLVMASQPGRERVASLLPPVHIALVTADQILPDLFDLFARAAATALPSNLVFITGPSKTGDIELQLTTGVHGPGTWHVVIVRQP